MIILLKYGLASLAMAVGFKILARNFSSFDRKPFNCPLCSAFWAGMLLRIAGKLFPVYADFILECLATAGFAWAVWAKITEDY